MYEHTHSIRGYMYGHTHMVVGAQVWTHIWYWEHRYGHTQGIRGYMYGHTYGYWGTGMDTHINMVGVCREVFPSTGKCSCPHEGILTHRYSRAQGGNLDHRELFSSTDPFSFHFIHLGYIVISIYKRSYLKVFELA